MILFSSTSCQYKNNFKKSFVLTVPWNFLIGNRKKVKNASIFFFPAAPIICQNKCKVFYSCSKNFGKIRGFFENAFHSVLKYSLYIFFHFNFSWLTKLMRTMCMKLFISHTFSQNVDFDWTFAVNDVPNSSRLRLHFYFIICSPISRTQVLLRGIVFW